MPTKKTTKKTPSRRKRKALDLPIVELSPEQVQFIADLERRYDEALQRQVCEVCRQGWRLPKNHYTSPDGTQWRMCVACDAMLHEMPKSTRKRAMFGLMDEMELMTARLPFFRAWIERRSCVVELESEVA